MSWLRERFQKGVRSLFMQVSLGGLIATGILWLCTGWDGLHLAVGGWLALYAIVSVEYWRHHLFDRDRRRD